MNSNPYTQVLEYLNIYGGEKYKKQEKCKNEEERIYMEEGMTCGRKAFSTFKSLVERISNNFSLTYEKVTTWQNSGNFVRYFWCQLKKADFKESNISLSLFAEAGKDYARFRASVELAVEASSKEEKEAYKSILDLKLIDDLCYISGGNNESEFRVLDEKDNKAVKHMNLNKVQVSYIVSKEECESEDAFLKLLESGFYLLLPYYDYVLEKTPNSGNMSNIWWPSKEEYNPGITKEKWIEILNNRDITEEEWLSLLAMYYDYGGEGTCSEIADKYGAPVEKLRNSLGVYFAEHICKFLEKPMPDLREDAKFWPVVFIGKKSNSNQKGSYIWKLRPELYDALTEFNIQKYLPKEGNDPEMTTKEKIDKIKEYIAAKGFTYDGNLIENFYLSLKSKPFVILAGTSGTGKTRLAKLFAEAIGAEFKLVPVRPDWSDSSDLFGHLDLSGNFVEGPVIQFIGDAIKNSSKPYILCLDEMNLARVEYYFSDFLSIMETREREGDRIVTDRFDLCDKAVKRFGEISIPDNLYIVGTVNMDETTFPFSKKVLDRANTIEFNYVDLNPQWNNQYDNCKANSFLNDFLKTEYIKLSECSEEAELVEKICSVLSDINKILVKADTHIGYRVRDEICFYLINNKKADLLDEDDAMDNQIMQKILSRVHVSNTTEKNMLCELFKICAGDFKGYQTDDAVADEMKKNVDNGNCKYQKSATEIQSMIRRFEED